MRTSLGPYKVGVSLVATCVNNGGLPPPALSWWREQRMIDDKYEEVILELMMVLTNDNCIMYISISITISGKWSDHQYSLSGEHLPGGPGGPAGVPGHQQQLLHPRLHQAEAPHCL